MCDLERDRNTIRKVLDRLASIPYSYGDLKGKVYFDRDADSYFLLTIGWNGKRRVHGILVHLEIIDGKVWIQRDGTEYGVARELEELGIPKQRIVLGFHSPGIRPHTDYAVA